MKKRTTKKKTGKTAKADLLKFVSKRYKLDTFWSWWLIRAIDKQAELCEIPVTEFCKSPYIRHFISGFLAARSMQEVVDQQNN